MRAVAARTAFSTMRLGVLRVLLEVLGEALVDDLLDEPGDLGLRSLPLFWPSNCGWVSLMLMTAVRPSRMSSPERPSFSFLTRSFLMAYLLIQLVSALRKPVRWAAVARVDVVGEGVELLIVGVAVLDGDLRLDAASSSPALECMRCGAGSRSASR
jgi:hypothetical protein